MFKGQKGVTLVALVITIIVLLILAGVSIAMLTGENGILKRSVEAVDETKIAEDREAAALDVNAAMTAYYDAKYVSADFTGTFAEFIASEKNTYVKADDTHYTFDKATLKITTKNKNKDGKTESATINANGGLNTWEANTGE